jgi:GNAT superfamily N-acetyltransferase
MVVEDVGAVDARTAEAFDDLRLRLGHADLWPARTEESARRNRAKLAHLLRQDAGGCWVAEAQEGVIGASVAIMREGLWGLSLLIVAPAHQGAGIGAVLLERALGYGDGGRAGIIASSDDPAAIRRYGRAGFELRPCMILKGRPSPPDALPSWSGVRPGTAADLALCEHVGRTVRGASHGSDLRALFDAGSGLLDSGAELLVVEDRGFALQHDGMPGMIAALDDEAARSLLLATLAEVPEGSDTFAPFVDARQGWAFDVALAAGLDIVPGGPLFVRGEVGPMTPYLPSGAYL